MFKNNPKPSISHFRKFITEIIFMVFFGVFVFLITRTHNLYESLGELLEKYEYLNLDEIFFTVLFVFGLLCFLGVQRYFELKREIKNSVDVQTALQKVLDEKNIVEGNLRYQEYITQEILSLVKKLEYANSNIEILQAVRQSVSKVLGYRTVWFYRFLEDGEHAELIFDGILPKSIRNQEIVRVNMYSSPYYEHIRYTKEIDIVEDAVTHSDLSSKKFIQDLQIHTLVHMPLLMYDESIGLLGTGSFGKQGVRVPTKSQLDFITSLSSYTALALFRINLQDQQAAAKQELKKSEEKYRLLIEQSSQAIYLLQDGKYEIVNENFLKLFGVTREEVENNEFTILQYTHPKSKQFLQERKEKANIGEAVPSTYEFSIITKDKRELEVEASITYVESDGKLKTQGILRDITSRKRSQKIQKAIFQISEASNSTKNVHQLISKIHMILKSVMYAENFFVEFYDHETKLYTSAYFADQYDVVDELVSDLAGSLTDYIRRTEKAQIIDDVLHAELAAKGEADYILKPAKVWMGAPLKTSDGVIGVIALQDYEDSLAYSIEDLELLTLISGQIANVLEKKKAEESIEKSSQFFKKVINSLDNPLYVIDVETNKIIIANTAAQEKIFKDGIHGFDCNGNIVSKSAHVDCKNNKCPITKIIESKKPNKFEQFYTTINDVESIYDVFAFPILNSEGKVIQIIENLVDISDRKRFENKLSELAAFPEANPNIVMSVNRDSQITYMNTATSMVLGDIGVSGDNLLDCLPQNFDSIIDSILRDYSEVQDVRVEINGHTLAWSFHPVIGQDIVHCYGFDISNLVKQTDKINKLSMVAVQTSNTVMITDTSGFIEYVNPYFCQVTGFTKEETIGKQVQEFYKVKTSTNKNNTIWKTISKGKTWAGKLENIKKNGDHYWESKTISPILNDKKEIISYISVGADITAEIETQRQLVEAEKHSAIATLAAGVAHEFKNYLGGIIGNASFSLDMINADDGFELAKDTLQKIIDMGEKANDVAMSLLTFSKAKPEDRNKEDLRKIILQAISLVEKELETLSIEVVTHFDEVPPIEVSLSKLQQLLLNLIINAKHAIGSNGVITVALVQKDNFVEIRIGDTGSGIDEKHLDKIFDPFFSTKGVWGKDAVSGTGMGLSICRNIAREHQGDLTVKSITGVGSVFTISLPLNDEEMNLYEDLSTQSDSKEQNIIFFTFNRSIVSHYYEDTCIAGLNLLLIDNFASIDDDVLKKTRYVVCDAKYLAKVELYHMIESCRSYQIPYVMVNCGTMEYQLTELYDGAVANYKEFPDFNKIKRDFESNSTSSPAKNV